MTPKGISVIVPHRDDLDGLRRCLDALASLPDRPYEIIVVDNGSAIDWQSIDSVIGQYYDLPIRFVFEAKRGAAHARNTGVKAAKQQFLAFIDCDCRPSREWLSKGLGMLECHAVVGGPVVVSWQNEEGPMTSAVAFDMLFGFDVAKSFRRNRHLLTSNMWIRRDVFDVVGPFRHGVSEDVEWCHRATAKGYQLAFNPDLQVCHRALPSRQRLNDRWRRITHESWLYGRERGESNIAWLAKCCVVAASTFVHGARPLFDRRLTGLRLRLETSALLAEIRMRRAIYGISLPFSSTVSRDVSLI